MSDSTCDCRVDYKLPISFSDDVCDKEEGEVQHPEPFLSEGIEPQISQISPFSITDDEARKLEFTELLFVRKRSNSKIVGKIDISVEKIREKTFLVGYRGCLPVVESIHTIRSFGLVNYNLKLLDQVTDEVHTNTVFNKTFTHKQHILKDDKETFNIREERFNDGKESLSRVFLMSSEEFDEITSETANILFLKQFARHNFVGKQYTRYLHLNGELCEAEYKCYDFEYITLGKTTVNAKRIRRRVIMPNLELAETNVYMSSRGQVLLMTWPGQMHYAVIHRKAVIVEGDVPKDPRDLIPLRERLEENPILTTILKEEMDRNILRAHTYIADHPEVKAILSFLSKTLLLYKPHRVVHFVRRNIAPYI